MADPARLPVLPVLGLAFTTCVEREPQADDPIVGDWIAVQIDDEAFPITYNDGEYTIRQGFSLAIEPELAGDFTFYYVGGYTGLESGSFYRFQLSVEPADSKYLLTIPNGLQTPIFGGYDDYADGGYDTATVPGDPSAGTYADTGYADTDTATAGDTGGSDTGGDTTGAAQARGALALPIVFGPEDTLVLRCELVGAENDALECNREPADDRGPVRWRFRKPAPGQPSGV